MSLTLCMLLYAHINMSHYKVTVFSTPDQYRGQYNIIVIASYRKPQELTLSRNGVCCVTCVATQKWVWRFWRILKMGVDPPPYPLQNPFVIASPILKSTLATALSCGERNSIASYYTFTKDIIFLGNTVPNCWM